MTIKYVTFKGAGDDTPCGGVLVEGVGGSGAEPEVIPLGVSVNHILRIGKPGLGFVKGKLSSGTGRVPLSSLTVLSYHDSYDPEATSVRSVRPGPRRPNIA